jgi:Na+-transporting methylmalonyl-CoA/oxaloacetate decarboxylase gamma subunit
MSNAMSIPKPPQQRAGHGRITLIKFVAIVAAVALTVFDAKVSWDGFKLMSLPEFVPLVLALLIFVVQLCSGAVQQLGMNPFYGVGGSPLMDFIWRWVLVGVYAIDVGSNAIAFGVPTYLTPLRAMRSPVDSLTMAVVLLLLSALLTFGDEILLRLVDRLDLGSKANAAAARKVAIDQDAYNRYLKGYKASALAQADAAGEQAAIDFDWMKEANE